MRCNYVVFLRYALYDLIVIYLPSLTFAFVLWKTSGSNLQLAFRALIAAIWVSSIAVLLLNGRNLVFCRI